MIIKILLDELIPLLCKILATGPVCTAKIIEAEPLISALDVALKKQHVF